AAAPGERQPVASRHSAMVRPTTLPRTRRKGTEMEISARNQLKGTVKSVTLGAVMAEVVVDLNGQEVVSAITRGSAERLGLAEGSPVTGIVKATEVLRATD